MSSESHQYRLSQPNQDERKRQYDHEYYLRNREKKCQHERERRAAGLTTYQQKPDHRSKYSKRLWKMLRDKALDAYGRKCACCGLTDEWALTFDHVHGGGNQHRKRTGGFGFLLWMEKSDYPPEIQVLCYNCNNGRRLFGVCPHQLALGAKLLQQFQEEENVNIPASLCITREVGTTLPRSAP